MSPVPLEQLSPSQRVFLRGEVFVQKRGNLELPSGIQISTRELAETMVTIAFLACDARDILVLQIQTESKLLGLRKIHHLFAEPMGRAVPWPPLTLEGRLVRLAEDRFPPGRQRVQTLAAALIEKDTLNPWGRVVHMVQEGLADWGILERRKEPRTKTGRRQRFRLAASAVDLVISLSTADTEALLENHGRANKELWPLLCQEIAYGIGRRD